MANTAATKQTFSSGCFLFHNLLLKLAVFHGRESVISATSRGSVVPQKLD